MRLKFVLALVGLLLLFSLFGLNAPATRAAEIRSGDRVVVAADEVIDDDLIVSANVVEIDGVVTGDLVAAARQIIVRGTVEGSAALAGQEILVSGQIDGSLYAAGYVVTLAEGAVVGRNVYFFGFALTTEPGSQIGRTLHASGAQVRHNGAIGGDLNVATSALEVNGQVSGDVTGQVSAAGAPARMPFGMPGLPPVEILTPGLRVAPEAQIGGQVLVQEMTTAPTAAEETGALGLPRWLSNRLGTVIGLLLTAAVVVYFAPRFLPAVSGALRRKPLPSLGWGALIYLLLFPLGLIVGLILVVLLTIVVGFVTFGQLTAAILGLAGSFWLFALFAFLFFVYVIAWLIVGHLAGDALLSRAGVGAGRWAQFLSVALGVVIFQALRAIPFLGFLVAFLVGTFALGALFVVWLERRRTGRADEMPPKPAGSVSA
jgi:cytoskeletal protein CcmA (bactofilin family)